MLSPTPSRYPTQLHQLTVTVNPRSTHRQPKCPVNGTLRAGERCSCVVVLVRTNTTTHEHPFVLVSGLRRSPDRFAGWRPREAGRFPGPGPQHTFGRVTRVRSREPCARSHAAARGCPRRAGIPRRGHPDPGARAERARERQGVLGGCVDRALQVEAAVDVGKPAEGEARFARAQGEARGERGARPFCRVRELGCPGSSQNIRARVPRQKPSDSRAGEDCSQPREGSPRRCCRACPRRLRARCRPGCCRCARWWVRPTDPNASSSSGTARPGPRGRTRAAVVRRHRAIPVAVRRSRCP